MSAYHTLLEGSKATLKGCASLRGRWNVETLPSRRRPRLASRNIPNHTLPSLATAIPLRQQLVPGSRSGQLHGFRWQVDVGPVGGDWDPGDADVAWIPELVTIRVRSVSGATVDLKTVRLMHRPQR